MDPFPKPFILLGHANANACPPRYDTGTISGILAMEYWQGLFSTGYRDPTGHLNVSPSQSSAIVSILSAGTFFGALSSPFLGDNIGRRLGLIASAVVFIFGVILQTAATSLPLFLAGRFFAGFGVGLLSALSKFFALSELGRASETRRQCGIDDALV